jgi:hypothetical protein
MAAENLNMAGKKIEDNLYEIGKLRCGMRAQPK